ncbi:hypothetical protein ABZW18_04140 [Streptomyces sp. NPDC004647]|uniref:hypothetical protein n=1 Tax=Streptomyces sp. NPDC004647 TaxID=3154671 RepID=UPI0033A687B3
MFNGFAAEARTRIITTLGSWSGLVADQRAVCPPVRQVGALSNFLLTHLTWLAAHPAAGELTAEVARAAGFARRAADPSSVQRVAVGPCVMRGCDGALSATIRGGRAGDTQVQCTAHPDHRWGEHEWAQLHRETRRSSPPTGEHWLAAPDIARLWNTPTGTVYRLASEQKWRRVSRAGRTYYAENDVAASLSRRKERAVRR